MYKIKNCKVCKKVIRKPSWLSVPRYNTRMFCSRKCYASFMRKNKLGWWKEFDFRKRTLTPEDVSAIEALIEFGYFKREEILLPGDTE